MTHTPAAAEGTSLCLHRSNLGPCRWFAIDLATGDAPEALCATLRSLHAEGVTIREGLLRKIATPDTRAEIHPCVTKEQFAFVFHAIAYHADDDDLIVPHEVELIVGRDYLVTVAAPWVHTRLRQDEFLRLWQYGADTTAEEAVTFLFQRIMRVVVDDYHDVLDEMQRPLADLERQVIDPQAVDDLGNIQRRIFQYSRAAVELRRHFGPLRRALEQICELTQQRTRPLPFVEVESWSKFHDLRTQVEHLVELVDSYHGILSNVLSAYQATFANHLADISNEMNKRMFLLTIITVLLAIPSIITGFYGMNLRGHGLGFDIPNAANWVAQLLVLWLLILVAISVGYLWFDHRKRINRGTRGQ